MASSRRKAGFFCSDRTGMSRIIRRESPLTLSLSRLLSGRERTPAPMGRAGVRGVTLRTIPYIPDLRHADPPRVKESKPPYGYQVAVKEVRGSKEKKVLTIVEEEARVVREIFSLSAGERGQPLGVKAIATRLNERGIRRRGCPLFYWQHLRHSDLDRVSRALLFQSVRQPQPKATSALPMD
jgi:hypothetical protein